jgi:hypothetical protein
MNEKFYHWLRITLIFFVLSRGILLFTGRAKDLATAEWIGLLFVAGWTAYFAGRLLVPVLLRSSWLYRLYRFRSPAIASGQLMRPPHAPGILERLYLHIRPPKWCRKSDDDLMIVYREQDKLLREGTIALGVLVQANDTLFQKGALNAPAVVIYISEVEVDNPIVPLMQAALKLYMLKGTKPEDPDEAKFARIVSYEMGRDFRVTVPDSLSNGLDATYTTIMVHRKHLPYGYLSGIYFPLLIHQESRAAMILPARYWPNEIILDWTPQANATTEAAPLNAQADKPG